MGKWFRRLYESHTYTIVIFIIIIASLSLNYILLPYAVKYTGDTSWLTKFIVALRDASLIAAFLSITDWALKGRLARNIISFMYGASQPKEIIDEIKDILTNPFIRENYEIQLILCSHLPSSFKEIITNLRAPRGYLYLDQTTTYTVKSLTSKRQPYTLYISLDQLVKKDQPIIYSIKIDNKIEHKAAKGKAGEFVYKKDKDILPNSSLAVEFSDVRLVREYDFLTVFFTHSTQLPNVRFNKEAVQNFNIEVKALIPKLDKDYKTWLCAGTLCKINQTFLPGQAILIKWDKK